MQKISQSKMPSALIAALLVLGLISSCAGKQTTETSPELPTSEASLLDESERATPVIDDSAVFADLAARPAAASNESEAAASTQDAASIPSGDAPFYNPIGGESLSRVAYTLYGDRKMSGQLLQQNPSLTKGLKLSLDQKVFFDFDQVRPMPTYLTKDLLDRYAGQLASKIEASGLGKQSVTLAPGETLQALSQRLYGTTRYWTEIYLLNRDSVSNYDRVPAGATLTAYQRPMVGTVTATPDSQVANGKESAPPVTDAPTQTIAQPIVPSEQMNTPTEVPAPPVTQPSAEAASPADPIPETPNFAQSVAEPTPVTQPEPIVVQKPVLSPPVDSSAGFFTNSTNIRRLSYVGLILLIGGLAYFLTRSSKKRGFDMLDVTTNDTAGGRAKLPKDSHHQDIG